MALKINVKPLDEWRVSDISVSELCFFFELV